MTQDNGMDTQEEIPPYCIGILARIFHGIASDIDDGKYEDAQSMAMSCARDFSEMAAKKGCEWEPITGVKEFSEYRQLPGQEIKTTPIALFPPFK